jgi:K+/H+ antiporter YhaU regulatory subunit KhtT
MLFLSGFPQFVHIEFYPIFALPKTAIVDREKFRSITGKKVNIIIKRKPQVINYYVNHSKHP